MHLQALRICCKPCASDIGNVVDMGFYLCIVLACSTCNQRMCCRCRYQGTCFEGVSGMFRWATDAHGFGGLVRQRIACILLCGATLL